MLAENNSGLKENDHVMLDFCEIPRDRVSIQARLGLKDVKHFRERYLSPMLHLGVVAITDPERPKSRHQKYWTTEAGMKLLETTEQL